MARPLLSKLSLPRLYLFGSLVVNWRIRAPSTWSPVGSCPDLQQTAVRKKKKNKQAGGPVLEPSPLQGWGKVPAAHASDTLHTACLRSEFRSCGQQGGGWSAKGPREAVGGLDAGSEWEGLAALQGNIQRRGKGARVWSRSEDKGVRNCEKLWEWKRVCGRVRCWAYVSLSVYAIVCEYGGGLAEVASLCLLSGFVVSHLPGIEAIAG